MKGRECNLPLLHWQLVPRVQYVWLADCSQGPNKPQKKYGGLWEICERCDSADWAHGPQTEPWSTMKFGLCGGLCPSLVRDTVKSFCTSKENDIFLHLTQYSNGAQ